MRRRRKGEGGEIKKWREEWGERWGRGSKGGGEERCGKGDEEEGGEMKEGEGGEMKEGEGGEMKEGESSVKLVTDGSDVM